MVEPRTAPEMYEELKRLWQLEHKWDDDEEGVEAQFEAFIAHLVQQENPFADPEPEREAPSLSAQLMELILEIDQTVSMVPPRVAKYRQLLADAGLDKQPALPEGDDALGLGAQGGGSSGMPGITLADQAALAFHGHVLQIALGIAQDAANEKLKKQAEQAANHEQEGTDHA